MEGIDFIIPWVDGNDPGWRARKEQCFFDSSADDREQRYRDWMLLKFFFRGIERYAPWVRRLYFICDQDVPGWLNTENEKLVVVRHEDYIPKEYLPAFSSHTIELNMHRIEGLSERFVYFNDDNFILRRINEEYFFKNGLPRDSALLNPVPTTDLDAEDKDSRVFSIPLNNAEYINRDFSFRKVLKKNPWKWLNLKYGKFFFINLMLSVWPRFVGFRDIHLPQPFLKSSFDEAWEKDADILDATSKNHIRGDRDINQWFVRERQLAEGKFVPKKPMKNAVFTVGRENAKLIQTIKKAEKTMICLQETSLDGDDFIKVRDEIIDAFETLLPEKCSFEK